MFGASLVLREATHWPDCDRSAKSRILPTCGLPLQEFRKLRVFPLKTSNLAVQSSFSPFGFKRWLGVKVWHMVCPKSKLVVDIPLRESKGAVSVRGHGCSQHNSESFAGSPFLPTEGPIRFATLHQGAAFQGLYTQGLHSWSPAPPEWMIPQYEAMEPRPRVPLEWRRFR